ncbi:MAG: hypothetical protein WAT19_07155 [Ferruginibacter sp.]
MPVAGMIVFILFYLTAVFYYPGGSQADKNAAGFSWQHNYWCNLLDDNAINGMVNDSKPFAITGMVILAFSIAVFWIQVSRHADTGKTLKIFILVPGILSMILLFLLLTGINHDDATNFASAAGFIAIIATLVQLYKNKWLGLFYVGLVNMLLIVLNNYFYYQADLLPFLPLVQKISFAAFLAWFCAVSLKMYRN